MDMTADDIRNAVLLSTASYSSSNDAVSILANTAWLPLGYDALPDPGDLPLFRPWPTWFGDGAFDSNYIFDNIHSQALAALNTQENTLAIAFRGTNSLSLLDWMSNIKNGLTSFENVYADFKYLFSSIDQYININGIKKVIVTGHSLGGVLAELYMSHHLIEIGVSYVGITFGSPSDTTLSPSGDPRVINFGHSEDPVVNLARLSARSNDDVIVDLPYENIGLVEHLLARISHTGLQPYLP